MASSAGWTPRHMMISWWAASVGEDAVKTQSIFLRLAMQHPHVADRPHDGFDQCRKPLIGGLHLVEISMLIISAANAANDVTEAALGMINRHAGAGHEAARA